MIVRDVEELVVVIRIVPAGDEPEVPAGEHARRGIHVLLVVVADAEREQLHDLAAEVLLRALTRVHASVEPDQHRRVLRDFNQELGEAAERVLAKELQLTLGPGKLAGDIGHHLRALHGADRAVDLAVRRREVVVPEQRHLFLQRSLRVHHSEQPTLPRVFDDGVRLEPAGTIEDRDVRGVSDPTVYVAGLILVVEQVIEHTRHRHAVERREIGLTGAKPRASKQMFNSRSASCHGVCLQISAQ